MKNARVIVFYGQFILCGATQALAQTPDSTPPPIEVRFKVFSAANPTIAVPSNIYRKITGGAKDLLSKTEADGSYVYRESQCALASYYAESLHPNVFPRREEWRQCSGQTAIEFALAPSGLSTTAITLLEGKVPDGFALPESYIPVVSALKEAQDQEQWGAVAKLSSHLAAQFRQAGYSTEANAFSEISLATAAAMAAEESQLQDTAWPLIATDKFGTPFLTEEAGKAIQSFQQNCGVQVTGQVGWTTMGCLAGGSGYSLPKETALFPQNDDFESKYEVRG